MASRWPSRMPLSSVSDASKPMKRTLPAHPLSTQHAHHRERRRFVGGEDAVDVEAAVGSLDPAQQRLALLVRAFDVCPAVLVRADDLQAGVRADGLEKAFLALNRALGTFGVAQQDDPSLVVQQRRKVLAGQAAREAVVGGHEADVVAPLQARVDHDDGDPVAFRVGHRLSERDLVERRQHDPDTPLVTNRSTSEICDSRSSSRSGPRQTIVTPSSWPAFAAPAWMLCQKACEVPLGTTAIVSEPAPVWLVFLQPAAKSSSSAMAVPILRVVKGDPPGPSGNYNLPIKSKYCGL